MSFEETEKRWENVKTIMKNLTKNQVKLLLTKFFEISEEPEVIALNRKNRSVDGFLLLKKKMLRYNISIYALADRDEIMISLGQGYQKIESVKQILIEEKDKKIEIYLREENEYLLSIFL
jgi:hypothetical protein